MASDPGSSDTVEFTAAGGRLTITSAADGYRVKVNSQDESKKEQNRLRAEIESLELKHVQDIDALKASIELPKAHIAEHQQRNMITAEAKIPRGFDFSSATNVTELDLHADLMTSLQQKGYGELFPMQVAVLNYTSRSSAPTFLDGATGTGKTTAVVVSMLNSAVQGRVQNGGPRLQRSDPVKPFAIYVAPTRCLTSDTASPACEIIESGSGLVKDLKIGLMVGDCPNTTRIKVKAESRFDREYVSADLVFATPSKLQNALKRGMLTLEETKLIVLDESNTLSGSHPRFSKAFMAEIVKATHNAVVKSVPNTNLGILVVASGPRKDFQKIVSNKLVGENASFTYLSVKEPCAVTKPTVHFHNLKMVKKGWDKMRPGDLFCREAGLLLVMNKLANEVAKGQKEGKFQQYGSVPGMLVVGGSTADIVSTNHFLNEVGKVPHGRVRSVYAKKSLKEQVLHMNAFKEERGGCRFLLCSTEIAIRGQNYPNDPIMIWYKDNGMSGRNLQKTFEAFYSRAGRMGHSGNIQVLLDLEETADLTLAEMLYDWAPEKGIEVPKFVKEKVEEVRAEREKEKGKGKKSWGNGGGSGGGSGGGNRSCFICESPEHVKSDCPHKDDPKCKECGQTGHTRAECPEVVCESCSEKGHLRRTCPRGPKCFNCDEVGHSKDQCDKGKKCNNCDGFGHEVRNCGLPRDQAKIDKAQQARIYCSICKVRGQHLTKNCRATPNERKSEKEKSDEWANESVNQTPWEDHSEGENAAVPAGNSGW